MVDAVSALISLLVVLKLMRQPLTTDDQDAEDHSSMPALINVSSSSFNIISGATHDGA